MKSLNTFLAIGLCLASATIATAAPWSGKYDELLKKYVTKDGVKYAKWKANANDLASLKSITKQIGDSKPSGSTDEQKAFYINAYNAWILDQVLERWPTKSILPNGIGEFFTAKQIKVNKRRMSFNNLEKKIIFKKFPDARIHFALNCGSKGCPPLANSAFKGENLSDHLDKLTKKFINSKAGVLFSKNKVTASSIFDWYEKDFVKDSGSVIKFINKYRKEDIPQRRINYSEYSWDVNAAN